MALISFPITDYAGNRKNMVVHVADGLTVADYESIADQFSVQLDNVTAGIISDAVLRLSLPVNGAVKAVADSNDNAKRGALLNFDTAGRYNYGLWVPAIKNALITGQSIELTGAVTTLGNIMVDGLTAPGGLRQFHNGYDQDITAFLGAIGTFRPK